MTAHIASWGDPEGLHLDILVPWADLEEEYNIADHDIPILIRKTELVGEASVALIGGMAKGTVKYALQHHTHAEWLAHAKDEAVDQLNYNFLIGSEWDKERTL